jgi:hypothetical protein
MCDISKLNYYLFEWMKIAGANLFEYMNLYLLSVTTWSDTYLYKCMNLYLL